MNDEKYSTDIANWTITLKGFWYEGDRDMMPATPRWSQSGFNFTKPLVNHADAPTNAQSLRNQIHQQNVFNTHNYKLYPTLCPVRQ